MKRRGFEGDPIEALRSADPLDRLDVPQDTTGAHARALFQEVTSMDVMERETIVRTQPPVRRRFALAASGIAMAVVVAVVAIAVVSGNDTAPDEQIAGGVPLASAAMCVESYDLDTLANRDVAFDGTVTSLDGDQVTFSVHKWFTDGSGNETTLNSNGLGGGATAPLDGSVDETTLDSNDLTSGGITSLGGPGLEEGQRYLVAGSGEFVWACGFTMTYDTAIANQWATVFGS